MRCIRSTLCADTCHSGFPICFGFALVSPLSSGPPILLDRIMFSDIGDAEISIPSSFGLSIVSRLAQGLHYAAG